MWRIPVLRKKREAAAGRRFWHSQVEGLESRLLLTVLPEEQLFVYLLNKARHDPQAYEDDQNLSVDLSDVAAQPPLAVNDSLFASARFHATEMADHNYFAHQSAVTGDWPNKMADDAGYDLPAYFDLNNNYIESIGAGNLYSDPQDMINLLVVDDGVPSLGHRKHLLSIGSFYEQSREIGVGHAFNASSTYDHYWAVHITFSDVNDTFLTGVVYNDANNNGEYDLNEGLSGVTVSAGGGLQTLTNAAGGWSIQVPSAGDYTVTAAGGGYVGTGSSLVSVGSQNREVDFRSGVAAGVIDFGTPTPGDNLPPENTVPMGPLLIVEDTSTVLAGFGITDPDAASATVQVALQVVHGRLTLATNVPGGLTGGMITGNNSTNVVLTGTMSQINTTLASAQGLRYLGNTDYSGADTLTMISSDLGHTGTGGALIDTDLVDLLVSAVNDAPVNVVPAGPVSVVTSESLTLSGLSFSDVDLGSDDAVITLEVGHGTLSVRTDVVGGLTPADVSNNNSGQVTLTGTSLELLATLGAPGGVTYVSTLAYIGSDLLTMTTSDQGSTGSGGTGVDIDTLSIQVLPVPLPPSLDVPDSSVASFRGKPVVVGAGGTVADPDTTNFSGAILTIQFTGGNQGNDLLYLNKEGKKTGQLNVVRGNVRLGKTVIGTVSGGTGGSELTIQFNSQADLSAVQSVLRNVAFRSKRKGLTATPREVTFRLTDPTDLDSNLETRTVNVTL